MNGLLLIQAMEQLLVVRNPHHMATVRTALEHGYFFVAPDICATEEDRLSSVQVFR